MHWSRLRLIKCSWLVISWVLSLILQLAPFSLPDSMLPELNSTMATTRHLSFLMPAAVISSLHANPETETIEAIADLERWVSIRESFPTADVSLPEVDYIIRDSLKMLETYPIAGAYDTQLRILERLISLRRNLDSLQLETTELSTAIYLRVKALVETKTTIRQVVSRISRYLAITAS